MQNVSKTYEISLTKTTKEENWPSQNIYTYIGKGALLKKPIINYQTFVGKQKA